MRFLSRNHVRLLIDKLSLINVPIHRSHTIRPATVKDIPNIVQFIAKEKPSWRVFPSFLKANVESYPGKTVIGEEEDKTISGLSCVTQLGEDIFMGAYTLVRKDKLRSGLGWSLYRRVLDTLGDGNFLIEAVNENVETFKRAGYKELFSVTIWCGKIDKVLRPLVLNKRSPVIIKNVINDDQGHILLYDRDVHPVPREWYIKKCIFGDISSKAKIAYSGSKVVGYGLLIPQPGGGFAHSLFADDISIATIILSSFISDLPDGTFLSITVPDEKKESCDLVKQIGLEPKDRLTRMYLKYPVNIPWKKMVFNTPGDFTFI